MIPLYLVGLALNAAAGIVAAQFGWYGWRYAAVTFLTITGTAISAWAISHRLP